MGSITPRQRKQVQTTRRRANSFLPERLGGFAANDLWVEAHIPQLRFIEACKFVTIPQAPEPDERQTGRPGNAGCSRDLFEPVEAGSGSPDLSNCPWLSLLPASSRLRALVAVAQGVAEAARLTRHGSHLSFGGATIAYIQPLRQEQ